MSCYKPNYIVKHKILSPSLRLEYRFQEKNDSRGRNGWKMIKNSDMEMKFFTGYDYDNFKNHVEDNFKMNCEVVQVPCGNCIGCRLDYSRQWANRCYLESLGSKNVYFITLTYDDEHLPVGKFGNNTLVPDDLKKFLKDLRRYYSYHYKLDNIRYFACGEYG